MELHEILDTVIEISYNLLCNGAEVFRVEESIQYICRAYEVERTEAFAIPASIVVTLEKDGESLTKSRRVKTRKIDLYKVEQLNALSRQICRELPSYEWVKLRLGEVQRGPVYSRGWQYGSRMLIGFSFTMFFGGKPADGFVGMLVGAFIAFLDEIFKKIRITPFFINVLCGFLAAFTANVLAAATGMFQSDKIIIGTIMLLVPGMAIANSMRDFISSDIMTGLSRLIEALFVAAGIAIGVGFGTMLVK